jgi:hypothetical protein
MARKAAPSAPVEARTWKGGATRWHRGEVEAGTRRSVGVDALWWNGPARRALVSCSVVAWWRCSNGALGAGARCLACSAAWSRNLGWWRGHRGAFTWRVGGQLERQQADGEALRKKVEGSKEATAADLGRPSGGWLLRSYSRDSRAPQAAPVILVVRARAGGGTDAETPGWDSRRRRRSLGFLSRARAS